MSGTPAYFDAHAAAYEAELAAGLRLTGEDRGYFVRGRLIRVARLLARQGVVPRAILDFGCGDGAGTLPLLSLPGAERVTGLDVSEALLARAGREHADPRVSYRRAGDATPDGAHDLAFVNGVFHHIPRAARGAALAEIHAWLRPGGLFAFWENNPWNPGTRLIMSRVPFDRDADLLTPPAARRLLASAGLEPVLTESAFWFPRLLAWCRPLEPLLAPLPLGGQYLILARRR